MIRFKATLADGRMFEGPIQGCGGRIGSAALHLGHKVAATYALEQIETVQRRCAQGRPLRVHEPHPGYVAMYPHETAQAAGEPVLIPLIGTRFEVLGEKKG